MGGEERVEPTDIGRILAVEVTIPFLVCRVTVGVSIPTPHKGIDFGVPWFSSNGISILTIKI